MLTMSKEPLKISWDELTTDKVEAKLQRIDAVNRAKEQFDKPTAPARVTSKPSKFAFLYNTLVYMALFGAVGGAVGWGFGEIMNFRPDDRIKSVDRIATYKQILEQKNNGQIPATVADAMLRGIINSSRNNERVMTEVDSRLTPDQKVARLQEIDERDQWKDFIATMLFFGISGMMISIFLSSAESVVSRNARGAILNASVGAAVGLIGGLVIAVFFNKLYAVLTKAFGGTVDQDSIILVHSIAWAVLGLFISIAPGLILRNFKRLVVGAAGGLIGGLIGGAMYDPVMRSIGDGGEHVARLVAIVTIGLVAGLGTGLLENAIKSGWIKVKEGLIAGKQFVLYRNPTYIGSAPNCHVYLFKDAKVGRRHAAIHVVPGGFEIEDLPLGERTRVNDKIVTRARLKLGDRIQVGATVFEFHEKAKKQG